MMTPEDMISIIDELKKIKEAKHIPSVKCKTVSAPAEPEKPFVPKPIPAIVSASPPPPPVVSTHIPFSSQPYTPTR